VEGVGAAGWENRLVRIVHHELDPNDNTVLLDCYDLEQILSAGFILGDETLLAATWATAPADDRVYGYLCDETTGLFSDGAPGKTLR
jgi:hypothetical protein